MIMNRIRHFVSQDCAAHNLRHFVSKDCITHNLRHFVSNFAFSTLQRRVLRTILICARRTLVGYFARFVTYFPFLIVIAFTLWNATAQEGDDFNFDFDLGDGSSTSSESSEGDFTFSSSPASSTSSPITFSGSGGLNVRFFIDTEHGYDSFDSLGDNTVMGWDPFFNFGIKYDGGVAELEAKTRLNLWTLGVESVSGRSPLWDILDELTARVYLGDWVLEAGKMRLVWGKGDKLHVLDNFNANDYTQFIIPDYLDRRIAEPMFHVVYNAPIKQNLRLEFAWCPIMTADRFAADGAFAPYKTHQIANVVKNKLEENVATALVSYNAALAMYSDPTNVTQAQAAAAAGAAYTAALAMSNNFSEGDLYEDTSTLKFGQLGGRVTWTAGQVDLGVSYYYGHYKEPTVNWDMINNFDLKESLTFDTLHVFGAELATILWKFNIRLEAAYNMTNDFSGDDPYVRNHSISWLGGFDIDLPCTALNLNIQEVGTALLNIDGVDSALDADYDSDSFYTHNKFVINLSDKYLHEKLQWELIGVIGVENGEVAILPKISYNPKAGFWITLRGGYIHAHDRDGELWNFTAYDDSSNHGGYNTRDKGWIELGARYDF